MKTLFIMAMVLAVSGCSKVMNTSSNYDFVGIRTCYQDVNTDGSVSFGPFGMPAPGIVVFKQYNADGSVSKINASNCD